MSEKAEWERLLDDSYQWRVGRYVALVLVLGAWLLLIRGSSWWFGAEMVFLGLYFGFRHKEMSMVKKAVKLRKEQDNGRTG